LLACWDWVDWIEFNWCRVAQTLYTARRVRFIFHLNILFFSLLFGIFTRLLDDSARLLLFSVFYLIGPVTRWHGGAIELRACLVEDRQQFVGLVGQSLKKSPVLIGMG